MERAAVTVGVGVVVGVLGALIKYAGWTELVAGYDPDRVEDDAGLAAFVGTHVLSVSLLTVLVGALDYARPDAAWYWLVYALAVLALGVRTVRGSRRFESSPENGPEA